MPVTKARARKVNSSGTIFAMLSTDLLRTKYLDFFAARGHKIIPSSSLVPENDPTTLFTGSGMQPMVPYLLGQPHPLGKRITDSQKCFRSQDIEEVGDNRHTTFFEMLGNWSLGDYFKADQLAWLFEFLTDPDKGVGLDPNKLFVTVFAGNDQLNLPKDEESVNIWQQLFDSKGIKAQVVENPAVQGINHGRIFFYPEAKNWWSRSGKPQDMPPGEPGGPDSEVFYDFGAELTLHENSPYRDQPCHVNCDCGRFLEVGNSVFMQYQKQADGSFKPLPAQNVDFGGGLERLMAAAQNNPDVFQTAFFQPLIEQLTHLTGQQYLSTQLVTKSFRIIADHIRAAVFLAADGVVPANKAQGYFARRLIRRSIRFGHLIGLTKPFLTELVPPIAQMYANIYPEIQEKTQEITNILRTEESKFAQALDKGMKELDKAGHLDEDLAFKLYESYGFPFELTQEIAKEKNITLSQDKFDQAKAAHSQASRTASAGMFKGGLADAGEQTTKYHTATHLLHAALRKVLGSSVRQMGSHITAERLRFDFACPQAPTTSKWDEIIKLINHWVDQDLPVTRQELPKDEASKSGAVAFFKEKYPDIVSVYTIGHDSQTDWISKEFCGGPHVPSTGIIGHLELVKEQSIGQGVRRVYLR